MVSPQNGSMLLRFVYEDTHPFSRWKARSQPGKASSPDKAKDSHRAKARLYGCLFLSALA